MSDQVGRRAVVLQALNAAAIGVRNLDIHKDEWSPTLINGARDGLDLAIREAMAYAAELTDLLPQAPEDEGELSPPEKWLLRQTVQTDQGAWVIHLHHDGFSAIARRLVRRGLGLTHRKGNSEEFWLNGDGLLAVEVAKGKRATA